MRNLSLILFILIFTFLSVPAFAGQGALKLPEGSNASAIKHNKEGIFNYKQGYYEDALKHFQMASKVDSSVGESHYNEALCLDKLGNTERQQIISTLRGNMLKETLPFLDLRFSMLILL